MTVVEPAAVAALLDAAHLERRTLDAASVDVGDLASAYAVQRELTSLRLSRGDEVVGWKLGYTTRAMRDQMGIDAPNLGPLLASMRVEGDATVSGIHPRIEPEIAFVMGDDPGPDPTPDDVRRCVAEVRLALEIVDSVWWGYRFDLEHNTADGSSAHGFVLGSSLDPALQRWEVELQVHDPVPGDLARRHVDPQDWITRQSAVGVVVDALASTAWLCGELAGRGLALRPGDVVLTGGLTPAPYLRAGGAAVAVVRGGDARAEVRRP